jgi:hypothetical protein
MVVKCPVLQLLEYYGRWQGFKGKAAQLPSWARFVLLVAAVPGILLIVLSILAFLVSLLALLLLTVPLYRLMCGLFGVRVEAAGGHSGFGPLPEGMEAVIDEAPAAGEGPAGETTVVETPVEGEMRPARRHIEVKIVE